MQELDKNVRHFIYQTFAASTSPPTTSEIAHHFTLSQQAAKASLQRLSAAHQIALAPGATNVWMAHPFSAIKTDFTTQVSGKTYWGN